MTATKYIDAPNRQVDVSGTPFAYRALGAGSDVPVIFLTHLAAVLDNWDPRVVDGIAAKHQAITFDNRGVGGLGGTTPETVEAMARDAVAFIHAWGKQQPADLSTIHHPVFVANGDDDRMVPTLNTVDLAKRLPNSTLKIYPDAGHGGIFQFHDEFVAQALEFLAN